MICTKCGQEKPDSEFYYTNKYIRSYCKKCDSQKRLQASREKKARVVELLGGKCAHCGIVEEPYLYDIDHIDPKLKTIKNISFVIQRRAESFWIDEVLNRCQLLCVRCHRIKTYTNHEYVR